MFEGVRVKGPGVRVGVRVKGPRVRVKVRGERHVKNTSRRPSTSDPLSPSPSPKVRRHGVGVAERVLGLRDQG